MTLINDTVVLEPFIGILLMFGATYGQKMILETSLPEFNPGKPLFQPDWVVEGTIAQTSPNVKFQVRVPSPRGLPTFLVEACSRPKKRLALFRAYLRVGHGHNPDRFK
jgi:hypothetical protein